jgi:hypothetical protein
VWQLTSFSLHITLTLNLSFSNSLKPKALLEILSIMDLANDLPRKVLNDRYFCRKIAVVDFSITLTTGR